MRDSKIRKAFGARLKELRNKKKWSQKILAQKLDIRVSHLNKYESGMHIPPIERLIKISELLDIPLDYLIIGSSMENFPLMNSGLFKRFKLLEGLNKEDQETVIKVIDAIIAKHRLESALEPL